MNDHPYPCRDVDGCGGCSNEDECEDLEDLLQIDVEKPMQGPSETDSIESLLPGLIELRNQALGENFDPAAAVLLSHTIAWMNWAKDNAQIHAAAPEMRLTLERVEKAIAFEMKRAYPDNLHGAVQIEDMDPGHADLWCALGLVRETLRRAEGRD